MAQSAQPTIQNRGLDWAMMSIYISLVLIGWMMVYSSNYDEENIYNFLDINHEVGRQSIWVVISLLVFISILTVEWNFWNTFSFPFYTISMIFLVLVLFFGTVVKGNKSWFNYGFLSFQPSELAKFGTCLAMASYMSFNKNNLKDSKVLFTAMAIFLSPVVLILLQPDAGSALVFFSFFMLLYRKGLSPLLYVLAFILLAIFIFSLTFSAYSVLIYTMIIIFCILIYNIGLDYQKSGLILGVAASTYFLYFYNFKSYAWIVPALACAYGMVMCYKKNNFRLISLTSIAGSLIIALSFGTQFLFDNVLKPHQAERINIWLRPEKCDPKGPLYNLIQSKLTIGSGGFAGKGFLNGEMTKLNYVPEQSTDFIFSIVGEEQGFIGCVSVIVLFFILIYRSILIAERAKLEFIRNYAYAVAGILFIHFFVNIGMTIGLMPIIGIPLPFVSRGGTSLLIFSIMMGVLIKMDASRMRA